MAQHRSMKFTMAIPMLALALAGNAHGNEQIELVHVPGGCFQKARHLPPADRSRMGVCLP